MFKLLKNIYGQKQAGTVYCVYYCNDIIFMVYIDDGIFIGSNDHSQLKDIIKELQNLNRKIKDWGHPAN